MTRLLRFSLLLSGCALLSLLTTAQSNYLGGYVVLPQNDTIKGQIDYKEWYYNPREIAFQNGKTGKKSLFSPDDITAFFAGGEVYRSFKVTIHPYSLSTEKLTSNFQDEPYDSTVFLRLVTDGPLSLYYYHGHDEVEYFFARQLNETPVQLRVKTSLVDNNGTKAIDREDLYIDQLRLLVSECPVLSGKVSHVAYDEKDLRKLIFTYNNCGKDTVERQGVTAGSRKLTRFIPLVGYIRTSMRTTGTYEGISNLTWAACNSIIGGLGAQFTMPRTRQQFSFMTDLLFSHFSSTSSSYAANSANVEKGYMQYNYLQLNIQFRYQIPEGNKVRPFVNAGISNTLALGYTDYISNHETGVAVDTRTPFLGTLMPNDNVSNPSPYQFGVMGGVGCTTGRFSLEVRVQANNGINALQDVDVTMKSFYVLAGFSF
jgi:hypothetical protein